SFKTQILLGAGIVDRIPPVMAKAIFHKSDRRIVRLSIDARMETIQFSANNTNEIEIVFFRVSTEAISRTWLYMFESQANSATVIFDVNPVSNISAVAVHRKWFPF